VRNEAVIIRRAQRGDEDSRTALARRWLPVAYGAALAATGRAADAEDATQEAFLRAFRQLDSLRDPRRFGPWLLRIVRNAARDGARRQARAGTLGDADGALPARAASVPDADGSTLSAWRRLDQDERLVCWLKIVEGMTFRDLASLLGVSKSTVDRTYRQGLAKMRRVVARC
jgi:RNA polymerase sigma-70 factor (ECF subfamily)